jgi:hypothetical protein
MTHGIILHIIHVSGKRMVNQGTNGLSRADHSMGVTTGRASQQGCSRPRAKIGDLVGSSNQGNAFWTLSPEGWFTTGHTYGNYIWAPAPSAVDVVVEQLGKAIMKQPESMHLIIVPRLMTGRWQRHLGRGTDGYFKLDCPFVWDLKNQFEPVLIYVCLPYISCRPRLTKQGELLDKFLALLPKAGMLSLSARQGWGMKRGSFVSWLLCRNEFPIKIQVDQDGVDITAPGDENRFKVARTGDYLMTPFQCEICHFHNINKWDPERYDLDDVEMIEYLHRCCKDALWSWETNAVKNNLWEAIRGRKSARRFKFSGEMTILPMGPYPLSDIFRMKATMVLVLERSLDPGKYATYVQWDTFWKARSAITNGSQASVTGLEDTIGAYKKRKCGSRRFLRTRSGSANVPQVSIGEL